MTDTLPQRLQNVRQRIQSAETRYGRHAGTVTLLAVSKTQTVAAIRALREAGQADFAENYVQEALQKIACLGTDNYCWHFIGRIQANKTREIAAYFNWVHSVDRLKIAQRLSQQRSAQQPPLNICLQVNIDKDSAKGGLTVEALPAVVAEIAGLPHLRLRGLMTIPAIHQAFNAQQQSYTRLKNCFDQLLAAGYPLDTLSMGMSQDMEAAIAAGSTLVRIGTALFGART